MARSVVESILAGKESGLRAGERVQRQFERMALAQQEAERYREEREMEGAERVFKFGLSQLEDVAWNILTPDEQKAPVIGTTQAAAKRMGIEWAFADPVPQAMLADFHNIGIDPAKRFWPSEQAYDYLEGIYGRYFHSALNELIDQAKLSGMEEEGRKAEGAYQTEVARIGAEEIAKGKGPTAEGAEAISAVPKPAPPKSRKQMIAESLFGDTRDAFPPEVEKLINAGAESEIARVVAMGNRSVKRALPIIARSLGLDENDPNAVFEHRREEIEAQKRDKKELGLTDALAKATGLIRDQGYSHEAAFAATSPELSQLIDLETYRPLVDMIAVEKPMTSTERRMREQSLVSMVRQAYRDGATDWETSGLRQELWEVRGGTGTMPPGYARVAPLTVGEEMRFGQAQQRISQAAQRSSRGGGSRGGGGTRVGEAAAGGKPANLKGATPKWMTTRIITEAGGWPDQDAWSKALSMDEFEMFYRKATSAALVHRPQSLKDVYVDDKYWSGDNLNEVGIRRLREINESEAKERGITPPKKKSAKEQKRISAFSPEMEKRLISMAKVVKGKLMFEQWVNVVKSTKLAKGDPDPRKFSTAELKKIWNSL